MDFGIPNLAQELSKSRSHKKETPMPALADDIEIWVLTHPSKASVTLATLSEAGIPYREYVNEDWMLPIDHPELETDRTNRPSLVEYALRQYRAFRGHQEILKQIKAPYAMVFEDDMTIHHDTNWAEVLDHILGARQFINDAGYDAVSFHARNTYTWQNPVMLYGSEYGELISEVQAGTGHQMFLSPVANAYDGKYKDFKFKWHEGCLAYMTGPAAREKWINAGHGHGMPCDLFLANELNTLVMRKSIFNHDDQYGSLIASNLKDSNVRTVHPVDLR